MKNYTEVYLGLGSNLGDRHTLLLQALELMIQHVGQLVRCSSFFETEPQGFTSDHAFLNAVALYRTTLTPEQLLATTQDIERQLGRTEKTQPGGAYTDRPIDIDILLYGDETVNTPELTIPHPHMNERDFVMKPLEELRRNLTSPHEF
ncbi:MAG: 2-amino-4-hydroxy-6-hydroxymethyldihydropteridine diphosphokinase [Bacteroidaceae bacterium]|nr:2-amino-4-hydroxy-6-hydroxymethyldihydropteridine diphosphokinase [Bacteroidaceae bacterium]